MNRIRFADLADQSLWDTFVLSQEHAGPYHLFAWRMAVEKSYQHKSYYLISEGEKADIQGVLPLILVKPPFMSGTLVSLPFCDYGGVLALHKDIKQQLLCSAYELAQSLNVALEIRNIYPETLLTSLYQLEAVSHKARMVLDLPESSDILWNGFKSKLRSQIKRPQKDGLIFKMGSLEKFDDFYTVFRINMRDLGSPVHSKTWISSVLGSFGTQAHVGVVYKDERPIAAGIIIENSNTISMPWASALSEFSKLSPNMLLYWGFLKYSCENGFRRFDFGRSTPGEGTYKFKEQWGATPYPLSWYSKGLSQNNGYSVRNGEIRKIIEKTWSRLPQCLVDIVGPKLRKYIIL
jgi:FemAB-related protein (PEP-CTERM system-associated)